MSKEQEQVAMSESEIVKRLKQFDDYAALRENMKDAIQQLKENLTILEGELIEALMAGKRALTAKNAKGVRGVIGKYFFRVDLGESLAAKKGNISDASFIEAFMLRVKKTHPEYVRLKPEINKERIRNDLRTGVIDANDLGVWGLMLDKAPYLSVIKARTDAELEDLIKQAEEANDKLEGTN